jgi:uncharacterized membrane protein YbhN (UPF0104 family)
MFALIFLLSLLVSTGVVFHSVIDNYRSMNPWIVVLAFLVFIADIILLVDYQKEIFLVYW